MEKGTWVTRWWSIDWSQIWRIANVHGNCRPWHDWLSPITLRFSSRRNFLLVRLRVSCACLASTKIYHTCRILWTKIALNPRWSPTNPCMTLQIAKDRQQRLQRIYFYHINLPAFKYNCCIQATICTPVSCNGIIFPLFTFGLVYTKRLIRAPCTWFVMKLHCKLAILKLLSLASLFHRTKLLIFNCTKFNDNFRN